MSSITMSSTHSWFSGYRETLDQTLTNKLNAIASLSSSEFISLWEFKKEIVIQALETVAKSSSLKKSDLGDALKPVISKLFSSMPDEGRKVDLFLLELLENSNSPDLCLVCFEFLGLEQMKSWLETKHGVIESLWEKADRMAKRLPQEHSRRRNNTWINEFKRNVRQCSVLFSSIINTFVSIFVFWSEGRIQINFHDKWATFEILLKIIMIPIVLFMWFKTLFTEQWQAYALTALVQCTAIGVIAYYSKFPPKPRALPDCEALIDMAEQNLLKPTIGRDEELGKALQGVIDGDVSLQPIFVAPSRVGKTKIMEKLAEFIVAAPPGSPIKDLQIFVISPSSVGSGFDSRIAETKQQLLSRIKGHEKNTIIVFEEIQEAMKQMNWGQFSDFLKKELDARSGIRCIAITTPEGYKTVKTDFAFAERFKMVIPIGSLSEIEVKLILQHYQYETVHDVLIDNSAIAKAVELTKCDGKCQPDKAQTLLTRACNKVRYNYHFYSSAALNEKKKELESLRFEYANENLVDTSYIDQSILQLVERKNLTEINEKIFLVAAELVEITELDRRKQKTCLHNFLREKVLELEIEALETKVQMTQSVLQKIKKLVKRSLFEKRASFQTAKKIRRYAREVIPEDVQRLFLHQLYVAQPKICEIISQLEEQLGTEVNARVNENFIQEVFEEAKRDLERAEQLIPA